MGHTKAQSESRALVQLLWPWLSLLRSLHSLTDPLTEGEGTPCPPVSMTSSGKELIVLHRLKGSPWWRPPDLDSLEGRPGLWECVNWEQLFNHGFYSQRGGSQTVTGKATGRGIFVGCSFAVRCRALNAGLVHARSTRVLALSNTLPTDGAWVRQGTQGWHKPLAAFTFDLFNKTSTGTSCWNLSAVPFLPRQRIQNVNVSAYAQKWTSGTWQLRWQRGRNCKSFSV